MAESSLAVVDYLLGQYDNFLQFAGQKDGATRCAQIVELLLANHVDHFFFKLLLLLSKVV